MQKPIPTNPLYSKQTSNHIIQEKPTCKSRFVLSSILESSNNIIQEKPPFYRWLNLMKITALQENHPCEWFPCCIYLSVIIPD